MLLKRLSTVCLVVLAFGILVGPAAAAAKHAPSPRHTPIVQIIQAFFGTFRYHNVEVAKAAGYAEFRDAAGIACIEHHELGTMGIHYVNGALLDAVLIPARPEALVYEPRPNGRLRLVALEYIVFEEAWKMAGNTRPPTLFGRQFDFTPAANRYGIPAFYSLHLWIWKHNPSGLFAPYNPRVSCEHAPAQ
jgi:hypothetical protein